MMRSDLHDIASEAYENTGDLEQALLHLKEAQTLHDSVFEQEREKQINQLEINYQVQQKEIENKLLRTEQAYTERLLKNRTNISAWLVVALFFAFGWILAVIRSNQQNRKMNEMLEAQVTLRTQELQLANKNLEQAYYELKTFNYIASHDIKEPIRNIGNYASLIFRKLPSEIKNGLEDYFQMIKKSTTNYIP